MHIPWFSLTAYNANFEVMGMRYIGPPTRKTALWVNKTHDTPPPLQTNSSAV